MEINKFNISDFEVIRHHLGELTENEDKIVIEWSHLNPHNQRLYQIYQRLILALNNLHSLRHYSINKAWQKLYQTDSD